MVLQTGPLMHLPSLAQLLRFFPREMKTLELLRCLNKGVYSCLGYGNMVIVLSYSAVFCVCVWGGGDCLKFSITMLWNITYV